MTPPLHEMMANATGTGIGQLEYHPMFVELLKRDDGWIDGENVSSLDYDFMTRHPEMSITFLVLTSISTAFGNVGNILVIGAVLSYRPLLRNKGSMFVVNLALADMLITSVVSPMNMIGVTKGPRFFLDKVMLCNLLGSICTVSCIVSMLSIAAVAVNRLVQICKYFMYHRIYTHRKTVGYCIALWGFALLLDLPNWVGWGGHTFGLKEMGCTFDRMANYSYTIFLVTITSGIPMIVVLTCYLAIILYVRKCRRDLRKFADDIKSQTTYLKEDSRKRPTYKKDDLQFAMILFISFISFVICWSPYMTALVFDRHDTWPKEVYVIGTVLGHSNSCLNPIIYAMGYARFRRGYYIFIHKLFCMPIKRDIHESRTGSVMHWKSKSTCKFPRSRLTKPVIDRSTRPGGRVAYSSNDMVTCPSTPHMLMVPSKFFKSEKRVPIKMIQDFYTDDSDRSSSA